VILGAKGVADHGTPNPQALFVVNAPDLQGCVGVLRREPFERKFHARPIRVEDQPGRKKSSIDGRIESFRAGEEPPHHRHPSFIERFQQVPDRSC
jgi:hypothetical protein